MSPVRSTYSCESTLPRGCSRRSSGIHGIGRCPGAQPVGEGVLANADDADANQLLARGPRASPARGAEVACRRRGRHGRARRIGPLAGAVRLLVGALCSEVETCSSAMPQMGHLPGWHADVGVHRADPLRARLLRLDARPGSGSPPRAITRPVTNQEDCTAGRCDVNDSCQCSTVGRVRRECRSPRVRCATGASPIARIQAARASSASRRPARFVELRLEQRRGARRAHRQRALRVLVREAGRLDEVPGLRHERAAQQRELSLGGSQARGGLGDQSAGRAIRPWRRRPSPHHAAPVASRTDAVSRGSAHGAVGHVKPTRAVNAPASPGISM